MQNVGLFLPRNAKFPHHLKERRSGAAMMQVLTPRSTRQYNFYFSNPVLCTYSYNLYILKYIRLIHGEHRRRVA